jgi:protein ImuA
VFFVCSILWVDEAPIVKRFAVMTDFWSHFPPKNTRTHEACGPSAPAFAAALAGHLCGANGKTVFWLRESWQGAQLNPVGFANYLDPKQLLIAQAARQIDALAAAEEALRSGHIALVVIELSQRIGLTEGRRLQLAAQEGDATGLCLLSEDMGSNAAQTRWRCTPVFDPNGAAVDSTLQNWEIIKNKSGTLKDWNVGWHAQTRRISVVSKPTQR